MPCCIFLDRTCCERKHGLEHAHGIWRTSWTFTLMSTVWLIRSVEVTFKILKFLFRFNPCPTSPPVLIPTDLRGPHICIFQILFDSGVAPLLRPLLMLTKGVACFDQIAIKEIGLWGQMLTAMTKPKPLCGAGIPSLPLKHLSLLQKIPLYLLHCGQSEPNLELSLVDWELKSDGFSQSCEG